MMKPNDEFIADARALYEKARDEGKEIAILTIAVALLDAYAEGADEVLSQHNLAKTPVVSDRKM